jgi:hypothetical protein
MDCTENIKKYMEDIIKNKKHFCSICFDTRNIEKNKSICSDCEYINNILNEVRKI